jgi:hypothetical protein
MILNQGHEGVLLTQKKKDTTLIMAFSVTCVTVSFTLF